MPLSGLVKERAGSFSTTCSFFFYSGGSHAGTFSGAEAASFSTFFAMLMIMPGTFISASGTYSHTKPAQLHNLTASKAHQLCCRIADSRAFHIQLYTLSHHSDILLPGAARRTIIAGSCAVKAGLYTFRIIINIIHNIPL